MLAIIQLIEYGIHSGADPSQSAKALFLNLWIQCVVLAICTYLYVSSSNNKTIVNIACANMIFYAVVFGVFLLYTLFSSAEFSAYVGESGHIEWYRNDGNLMGNFGFIYIIGIFLPLFILLSYYNWSDVGLLILLIYGIGSAIYVKYYFPPEAFSSMWCYLSIGFAFLLWMTGLIPCENNNCK